MAINNIADLFVATLEQAGMGCATATGNRRRLSRRIGNNLISTCDSSIVRRLRLLSLSSG